MGDKIFDLGVENEALIDKFFKCVKLFDWVDHSTSWGNHLDSFTGLSQRKATTLISFESEFRYFKHREVNAFVERWRQLCVKEFSMRCFYNKGVKESRCEFYWRSTYKRMERMDAIRNKKSEMDQSNKWRVELILTDPKRANVKELKDLKEDTHLRYNNNNNSNNSKLKTKVALLMKKCLQMQKRRINCMR